MSDPGAIVTRADHAPPALVVYGRDDGGKPHASVFTDSEADLAEMAAGLMGKRAFRLAEPEHLATVAGLPQGRVFASGKAFVPFVKAAVYDRLTALGGEPAPKVSDRVGVPAAKKAGLQITGLPKSQTQPGSLAGDVDGFGSTSVSATSAGPFAIGMVVLAPELEMSWWEAVIVAVYEEGVTLKWRDFPEEPTFKRQLNQLAFLPDGYVLPG